MFNLFLLTIPVISLFFNLEGSGLPKIHVSLYDLMIPILFITLTVKSCVLNTREHVFFKEDAVILGLIILGACFSSTFISGAYANLLKDLAKLLFFVMGLNVYRYYFQNWNNSKTLGFFPVLGLIMLSIIHPYPFLGEGYIYLTAFAFYIFFTWLLYAYLSVKESTLKLGLFMCVTLIVIAIFILYRRLELLGLMGVSLVVFGAERYSLSQKQIASLLCSITVIICCIIYIYMDNFNQSLLIRLPLWQHAWQLGADNFPFGIGLGQYQAQQLMPEAHLIQGARCTEFQYPHNQFLYWFVEMGIIGIILGIAFIKLIFAYLSHLKFIWKYSIFFMLMVVCCTHDAISLRSLPVFLALIFVFSQKSQNAVMSPEAR